MIVTYRGAEWDVHLAYASGARGYLLHSGGSDQLERAIRAVGSGLRYVSPLVAESAVGIFQFTSLSKRQIEVLRLLAEGCCNKMIAHELSIEVETVKSHLRDLFSKAGSQRA
jgi:DNA-binding NarL/FixJ family response regulator